MNSLGIAFTLLLLLAVGACTPGPPAENCVDGEYSLNGAGDVKLIISESRFRLIVGSDVVVGSFRFKQQESLFEFASESGQISTANKRRVTAQLGRIGADASFLHDFDLGRPGVAYEVYQSDRVVIQMDYESAFFWKHGCPR
jgi:hypothetical protein